MEGHVSDTDGEEDPVDALLKESQIDDTSDVSFLRATNNLFFSYFFQSPRVRRPRRTSRKQAPISNQKTGCTPLRKRPSRKRTCFDFISFYFILFS